MDGAEVAEGGVALGGVVERFDLVEDRSGEPGAGGPSMPVEECALQRRDQTVRRGARTHAVGLVVARR